MSEQQKIRISNRLREIRNARNLSAKEVADKIGCSVMTIFAYERGDRTPKPIRMKQLAEILNSDVSTLFFDEGEQL